MNPIVGRVLKGAMIREILVESSQCYAHETRPRQCTLSRFLCSISLQLLCCSLLLPYIDRIWLLNFRLYMGKNPKVFYKEFVDHFFFLSFPLQTLPVYLNQWHVVKICLPWNISSWLIDIKKGRPIWVIAKKRNLSIVLLVVGLIKPNFLCLSVLMT